jgi:hypothetical protein
MAFSSRPSKELVRRYMHQRQADHKPPPDQSEVRRQLGWNLLTPRRPARP